MTFTQKLVAVFNNASRNGKTQDSIAKDLGVDPSTVSKWLSGAQNPRYKMRVSLAEYFHLDHDYFLDDAELPLFTPGEENSGEYSDTELALIYIFRSMNEEGQTTLISVARALAAQNPRTQSLSNLA